jgi:hypothetical protein
VADGEVFELVDGERLEFNDFFIRKALSSHDDNEKVMVVAIVG